MCYAKANVLNRNKLDAINTTMAFWFFKYSCSIYFIRVSFNFFRRFWLVTSLSLIFFSVEAQQPYSLIHYDENALPQTTIGNIQQDEHGFLWMSSQYGIVRFDGEKARVFTTNNVRALTSNRIRLCAKGRDGSIYFVDENYAVLKVRSPNRFERIKNTEEASDTGPLPIYASGSINDFAFLPLLKNWSYEKFKNFLQFHSRREFLKSYATGDGTGYLFYMDWKQNIQLLYYDAQQYKLALQKKDFKVQHTFKLDNHVISQTGATKAAFFMRGEIGQAVSVSGLPDTFDPLFTGEKQVLFSNQTGAFFYASGSLYQYRRCRERNAGAGQSHGQQHCLCAGILEPTANFVQRIHYAGFGQRCFKPF
jgi:hypothetical protein